MKLTLACSSGISGRSTTLLLIVIVVIITLCIEPTAIQVVLQLLKITLNCSLLFLEGKASTSSIGLMKAEKPELLLFTKHS